MTPLSALDLSPIVEGSNASQSLANSLDLARQHAGHRQRRHLHRHCPCRRRHQDDTRRRRAHVREPG
ncbi:hypothetical protein [Mesorhizobium sp. ISC15]|uniref:hypothetical protein n=1 Tax=Mesorhizobium sp. ISC15 TaxID=3076429 RepID=UPI003FA614E2